jgi:membrane associated rhomboid family serine protease
MPVGGRRESEAALRRGRANAWIGSAALLILLSGVYAVELASGAIGHDHRLLMLGALPDSGGLHHQYWRLLTFGFLHSDSTHLLLNLLLLVLAGPAVERRGGAFWMLACFACASLASGIGIAAKHASLPSAGVSVGASGGMFGLLACALVLVVRFDRGNVLARTSLAIALVLGLAYSMLPGISLLGHAIGLAVGSAVAMCIPGRAAA